MMVHHPEINLIHHINKMKGENNMIILIYVMCVFLEYAIYIPLVVLSNSFRSTKKFRCLKHF